MKYNKRDISKKHKGNVNLPIYRATWKKAKYSLRSFRLKSTLNTFTIQKSVDRYILSEYS